MESFSVLTDAYEGVLRGCKELETYYETVKDSGNLSAVSNELEAIEEDFTEVKGIVKGYLNGTSRSSAKDQTERLRAEVSKREEELSRIEQEIKQTYAECERQLIQNFRNEKLPTEPDQGSGETTPSELRDRERESEREREGLKETLLSRELLREQNSGVQTQPVVSSPTQISIASTVIEKTTGFLLLRSPELFIRLLHLLRFILRIQCCLFPPQWNSTFSFDSAVNFSDTCSFSRKLSASVACLAVFYSNVPSSHIYVPSPAHQLPFSGGQGQLTSTGSNQPFSLSASDQISADSSALLKRVSVLKFFGQKKNYEAWKATFYSCVDRTTVTLEYKLLRLRECLQGEPLKLIENLDHSAAAYEAAKTRLERKYGGKRRALTLRLEELKAFKPVRVNSERDLEKCSELLDGIVVNLKDANQETELGNGSLYITLQRKFNKSLLSKYKRWISDNHRTEDVETLREFVDRESEFLTTASETISGVLKEPSKKEKNVPLAGSSFVARDPSFNKKKSSQACKLCNEQHGVWTCESFKRMTVSKRWEEATEHKLCFRCLADGHREEACFRSSVWTKWMQIAPFPFPLKKGLRSGTDGVVSHRLLLCATKWRGKGKKFGLGLIEQCVEDFCSVP